MNTLEPAPSRRDAPPTPQPPHDGAATRIGDLLPLGDFLCLVFAAWLSTQTLSAAFGTVLAPFMLHDRRFGSAATRGAIPDLVHSHAMRFALFMLVLLPLGALGGHPLPPGLTTFAAFGLLSTSLLRGGAAWHLHRRQHAAAAPADTQARIDYVADTMPVTLLCDRPIKRWDAVAKGAEDLLLGALLTLALLPLMALIAVAIKLSGPGPVLFRQRRHALDNREFEIYKFRTMRWTPPSASSSTPPMQQTGRHDLRVTRLGRWLRVSSLDELPQLFNVLQGQMSLVGPRPHATDMRTESRLGDEIAQDYAHRHRVKPGITGWAQVNGARGATDTEAQLRRRIALDLYYIDHWSLLLDLKILALTSAVVLKGTNAY